MDASLDETAIDAPWYEATYPDVALSGLGPVDHYRLIGQRLGRPARPEPPRGQLAEIVAAVADMPCAEDRPAARATDSDLPIIDAPRDPSAGLGRSDSAAEDGVPSGWPLAGSAWGPESLRRHGPRLSLFARLHGRAARDMFGLPDDMPGTKAHGGPIEVIGPKLRHGPFRIKDIWFASSATLCLRLDGLEDGQGGYSLRLHQADPAAAGGLQRVGGQRLAPRGPGFVEADLRNPLMPVLVELAGPDGAIRDLAVLAFPSLARGGLHAAELVGQIDGQSTTEALWAYTEGRLADLLEPKRNGRLSRVLVWLDGAGGGEPILSRAVAEWLGLFGLSAEPMPEDWERLGAAQPARASGCEGAALALPCDSLPTVAALTEPRLPNPGTGRRIAVPHLVADATNGRPRWAVTPPRHQDDPDGLPGPGSVPLLLGTGASGDGTPTLLPLAIRYRDPRPAEPLQLLLPSLPEITVPISRAGHGVLCVLNVTDAAAARIALAALAAQQGIDGMRLVLSGDESAVSALEPERAGLLGGQVEHLASGRSRTVSALVEAAEGADALLLLEDRVLLHDPRTLAHLRAMLASGRTASAACVTLHESMRGNSVVMETESGGYFPSRIGFLGGPHLLFERPDTAQALPSSTYPVVANALSAALISREVLAEAAPLLPERPLDDLTFGLVARALGWRHLCTSVVRATSLRPRSKGERADPVALRRIAPARWEELLADVTLLQELR